MSKRYARKYFNTQDEKAVKPIVVFRTDDQLAQFMNELETTGAWCVTSINQSHSHLMLAKHPKATMAISRCGQQIAPFWKLSQTSQVQHCLICELYSSGGKEVQYRNEQALQAIVSKFEPNPNSN